jgi:hypothetical protein
MGSIKGFHKIIGFLFLSFSLNSCKAMLEFSSLSELMVPDMPRLVFVGPQPTITRKGEFNKEFRFKFETPSEYQSNNTSTSNYSRIFYALDQNSKLSCDGKSNLYNSNQEFFVAADSVFIIRAIACDDEANSSKELVRIFKPLEETPPPNLISPADPVISFVNPDLANSLFFKTKIIVTLVPGSSSDQGKVDFFYTTSNQPLTCQNGTLYTGPIEIKGASTTLKAISCSKENNLHSSVVSSPTFTLDNVAPEGQVQFSQPSRTFNGSITISLSHPDQTAEIFYNLNGQASCLAPSIAYVRGQSITLNSTKSLSAVACDLLKNRGTLHSQTYTRDDNSLVVSPPTINPMGQRFNPNLNFKVSISAMGNGEGPLTASPHISGEGRALGNIQNYIPEIISPEINEAFSSNTTNIVLSWAAVPGVSRYYVRAAEFSNDSYSPEALTNRRLSNIKTHYLYVDNHLGTSINLSVNKGHWYEFWIHSKVNNTAGAKNFVRFSVRSDQVASAPVRYTFNDSVQLSSCSSGAAFDGTPITLPNQAIVNLRAIACDNSGNKSIEVSQNYIRDTTPPAAPVLSHSSQAFKDQFTLTIAAEAGATIRYNLTGSSINSCSSGSAYPLNGILISGTTRNLRAIACDQAGNISPTAQAIYSFDNTPPNLNVTSPTYLHSTSSNFVMSGDCESGNNVTLVNGNQTLSTPCNNSQFSLQIAISQLNIGQNTLHLSQSDNLGNIAHLQHIIIRERLMRNFSEVQAVLQKCILCHANISGAEARHAPLVFSNEDEAFNSPLFNRRDIESRGLLRTKGSKRGIELGFKVDMPTSGPWSQEEYQILEDWVMTASLSTNPNDLTTEMGGNGDDNLLAPENKSIFFNLESAQKMNSMAAACSSAPSAQSSRPLHRLSKIEYRNTVSDVLEILLGSSNALAVMTQLEAKLNLLPDDIKSHHGDFLSNADKSIDDNHLRAYSEIAIDLAKQIENRRSLAFGSCGSTSVDQSCFTQFLNNKGHFILRQPVSEEERIYYLSVLDQKGLSVALATLFMAPRFLYHSEINRGESSNSYNLSAWELASKLSYALWGSMPDEALFASAANGDLLDNTKYRNQALRLFQHSKARKHLKVFVKEWLKLDELPLIDLSNPPTAYLWKTIPGAPQTINAEAIRDQAIDEITDLVEYYVYDAPASSKRLSGLMLSRLSKAGDDLRQGLYHGSQPGPRGVSPAGGQWFKFADQNRRGILNRAAFHMHDGFSRRPIMKGVKILDRILCRPVALPEDNANPDNVVIEKTFSARQQTAALTEIPSTSCIGCHANINPIGYVFEGFDPFGRKSSLEHIIDPETLNPTSSLAIKPVDTAAQFGFQAGSPYLDDSVFFVNAVAESFEFHKCFSRFWWRHVNRRSDVAADSCHIEETYKKLEDQNSGLPNGMLEAVLHPNFKKRLRN